MEKMKLKLKVKTTWEIWNNYALDLNKKWVPLEDTQNLEAENEKLEDENLQLKEANYDMLYQIAFLKEDAQKLEHINIALSFALEAEQKMRDEVNKIFDEPNWTKEDLNLRKRLWESLQ
jgi:hypothetical protein